MVLDVISFIAAALGAYLLGRNESIRRSTATVLVVKEHEHVFVVVLCDTNVNRVFREARVET